MRPKISSIIAEAAGKLKKDARAVVLQRHDHPALRIVLACAFNPHVRWDLPDAEPEYKPNELAHDQESILYNEVRKLYLFLHPNHIFREYNGRLSQERRQQLFVQLLEQVDREDAKLLLAARKKKVHVKLSREAVEEAFPGLTTFGSH